ncbi:MAG: ribosome-associated protein [Halieaceae bacterium]|jgi:ribosome-associated protein
MIEVGNEPDEDLEEGPPSKSARKREMTARQTLGEALCDLSERELARMPMESPALLQAVLEAKRIRSNSALRRHRQYIGKLMRGIDPEPLQEALDELHQTRRGEALQFQALEELRDLLIRDGDLALPVLLERFPAADRQNVRQLLRRAHVEAEKEQPPSASRRLFRYLRELQAQEPA